MNEKQVVFVVTVEKLPSGGKHITSNWLGDKEAKNEAMGIIFEELIRKIKP